MTVLAIYEAFQVCGTEITQTLTMSSVGAVLSRHACMISLYINRYTLELGYYY